MEAQRAKLARPRGALKVALANYADWDSALSVLLNSSSGWVELASSAARLGTFVKLEVRRLASERRIENNGRFWEWVDDQLMGGAGGLHRLARGGQNSPDPPVPITLEDGSLGRSSLPRDILNDEVSKWSQVWLRHEGAEAPWRLREGEDVPPPAAAYPGAAAGCGFVPRP